MPQNFRHFHNPGNIPDGERHACRSVNAFPCEFRKEPLIDRVSITEHSWVNKVDSALIDPVHVMGVNVIGHQIKTPRFNQGLSDFAVTQRDDL